MAKEICVDLRIARSRSGLSGNDMAHLLECGKDSVSKLENWAARLTQEEMTRMQLICGGRFEETFSILCQEVAQTLFKLLSGMPSEPVHWAGKRSARLQTLDRLSQRLQAYLHNPNEK
jgi:hypothetical protein